MAHPAVDLLLLLLRAVGELLAVVRLIEVVVVALIMLVAVDVVVTVLMLLLPSAVVEVEVVVPILLLADALADADVDRMAADVGVVLLPFALVVLKDSSCVAFVVGCMTVTSSPQSSVSYCAQCHVLETGSWHFYHAGPYSVALSTSPTHDLYLLFLGESTKAQYFVAYILYPSSLNH